MPLYAEKIETLPDLIERLQEVQRSYDLEQGCRVAFYSTTGDKLRVFEVYAEDGILCLDMQDAT